jgi:hexosaminidase
MNFSRINGRGRVLTRVRRNLAVSISAGTALLLCSATFSMSQSATLPIMPLPSDVQTHDGRQVLSPHFSYFTSGARDERIDRAVARTLRQVEERSGLLFDRTPEGKFVAAADGKAAALLIDCRAASAAIPQLGEDESYTLEISTAQTVLRAPTTLGVLRGLATWTQLVKSDRSGWFLPALTMRDAPHFGWRGLLIDVARHWQPIDVIKRNLDGMALVKLNVLHLHLTEDQGFRIESKTHPKLHELGSDGLYFTQKQIREIIAYAAERGIRVVPEFDMPGHATSWVVGYPNLASAPGPYAIERRWGVFDPVLDPTNEDVYKLLEAFLGEMAALFPDPYLHIGGDENNGKQWTANAKIQEFIREKNLKDNGGLHAYFNRRLLDILQKNGKKLVGWDEILHPDLPKDAVVQSWRGAAGLAAASKAGHNVILSNGYYIDLIQPAREHYAIDPLPAGNTLTAEEQARVLGGEATMWAEWVGPETIDSRIWPRTAAIAERLWSPREVKDKADMYRRLDYVSRRLDEIGLQHLRYREPMLRTYAGDAAQNEDLAVLRELLTLLEPVKGYRRNHAMNDAGPSQFIPLTGLPDLAGPDAPATRAFAEAAEPVIFEKGNPSELRAAFEHWRRVAARLQDCAASGRLGPRSGEVASIGQQLAELAEIGQEVVNAAESSSSETHGAAWRDQIIEKLDKNAGSAPVVEFPAANSLKLLAAAVSERPRQGEFAPAAWRKHLKALAFPKKSK